MGTHGRTGMAHLMMGSVAERIIRTSSIPVLTVRRSKEKETEKISQEEQAGEAALVNLRLRQTTALP